MVDTIQKDFEKFNIKYEENIDDESHNEYIKSKFLIAIEKDDPYAMYELGFHYYLIIKNYDKMEEYYSMAAEKGYVRAMFDLGYYYQYTKINYELMIKYYLMLIKKKGYSNNDKLFYFYTRIELYNYYHNNIMAFYILIVNIENKSDLINNLLNELKSYKLIINYEKNLDNIHECDVCYETKINIKLPCNHEICVDCYPQINICHMCRAEIVVDE